MNKEEIFKRLLSMIKEILPSIDEQSISYSTKIFTDLNLDSISLLYLALLIEKEFNYKLTNENLESIITVDNLINAILNK